MEDQPSLSSDSRAQRQGWRAWRRASPITAAPPLCSAPHPRPLGGGSGSWVCVQMPLPKILQMGKLRSRRGVRPQITEGSDAPVACA